MKGVITAAVWIIGICCIAVMKKISPENFRAYAVYAGIICSVFTILVIVGAI